tara:strand:+ start:218 stop:691 length:474 start_codon:yes stop_codon:yes gene_type:complete
MNFVYYIKEYFAVIFYFLIIFNVIISVIYSKSKKISKKKSTKKSTKRSTKRRNRKGGGSQILKIILCFLTFGLYCPGRGTDYFMWIFGDSNPRTATSLNEYQEDLEDDYHFHMESKTAIQNSMDGMTDFIPDTRSWDEILNEWAEKVEYVFKYGVDW